MRERAEATIVPEFEGGDIICLTAAAIRRKEFANMTPRLLYEIGHPNQFHVLRSVMHEGQPFVTLIDCCSWERQEGQWDEHDGFIDRETGKVRCTGHPAMLFEKKAYKRTPKKGDKSSSVHIPLMPYALAGIQWEDDDNPVLKIEGLGATLGALTGIPAKIVKKLLEDNNLL